MRFFVNSYIFIITLAVCAKAYFERESKTKVMLMLVSSLFAFWFTLTDHVWIGFLLWESISVISAIMIWGNDPKKFAPAMRVLFISLISGLCYLLAVCELPLNAGFANLTTNAQIFMAAAIIIKSGFFPFIWPQIASVADHNTSALLHSVTAIQMGVYVAIKTKIHEYPLAYSIIEPFAYATIIFAVLYFLLCDKAKERLACLTQAANSVALLSIAAPDISASIAYSALCKSMLFLHLGTTGAISIFFMLLAQIGFYLTPFHASIEGIFAKGLLISFFFSRGYIVVYPNLEAFVTGIVTFFLLGIKLPKIKIPKISLDHIMSLFFIILAMLAFAQIDSLIYLGRDFVAWDNFARLLSSNLQLITLLPFGIGIYNLLRAKDKVQLVVSMNIISACVAVLLFENGGTEICVTHVLADAILTIVLLKSDVGEINIETDWRKIWIIPATFLLTVLLHRQSTTDLVFRGNLNDIIVDFRLQDTLGEILVFTISRFL